MTFTPLFARTLYAMARVRAGMSRAGAHPPNSLEKSPRFCFGGSDVGVGCTFTVEGAGGGVCTFGADVGGACTFAVEGAEVGGGCTFAEEAAALLGAPSSALLFWRLFTRSSTTAGSASVEVSPRLPDSSSAILRRMRRMILPERVFGRPGAHCR